jgi:hypothetical protein
MWSKDCWIAYDRHAIQLLWKVSVYQVQYYKFDSSSTLRYEQTNQNIGALQLSIVKYYKYNGKT